ncbi:recombinase RecA [Spiroplasma endosymbiont of Aspidapion aeneum]|uniref:recombinase RecA n=1 Tax=Spiroplasma endosymbiont of Aspidapion aeneum TaxID=3066276 RepID=UPI003CC7B010
MSTKDDDNIKKILKDIQKTYGSGAITTLGDIGDVNVDVISTGSYLIDRAIGIGGLPRGRIVEVYGPESSGKTTLCLQTVGEAQKSGGRAAYIDVEHALDPQYAKNIGVDISNLIVSQPNSGEEALEILEKLVSSNLLDIIILDSVAALVPKAELDGEMGDQQIGLQARLMSKAMRKLNALISKTNTTVVFINQLREKVGVVFGNPEVTPGGRALKFYSSLRIEVRKSEVLTNNGEATANKVKVKIVKNKISPPFKTCIITIIFNQGIDKMLEIIELATELSILDKAGSWYSYKGERIGLGKEVVKEWLINNPKLKDEIVKSVFN